MPPGRKSFRYTLASQPAGISTKHETQYNNVRLPKSVLAKLKIIAIIESNERGIKLTHNQLQREILIAYVQNYKPNEDSLKKIESKYYPKRNWRLKENERSKES